jgi:hypothetical protein
VSGPDEWQRDGSVIGQTSFPHEPDWLKQRVARHLGFWDGTRGESTKTAGVGGVDGVLCGAAGGGDVLGDTTAIEVTAATVGTEG